MSKLFKPAAKRRAFRLFVLAARMLKDKGVHEFVDAARIARSRGVIARFALVGDTDRENPAAISRDQLERGTLKATSNGGDIESTWPTCCARRMSYVSLPIAKACLRCCSRPRHAADH